MHKYESLRSAVKFLNFPAQFNRGARPDLAEVEVRHAGADSDEEYGTRDTLKLTTRVRPTPSPPLVRKSSRNEAKKKVTDEDEATLRELLIRYRCRIKRKYILSAQNTIGKMN